jgi:hypothetical protein
MVHVMVGEASRVTRLSIHADDLARGVYESIAELREIATICRRQGDMREAIVANKAAGDLCETLLRNASDMFSGGKALSPEAATKALVAAGWRPPNTLVGLPAPDWCPKPSIVEAKPVEHESDNDSNQNVTNQLEQDHG